MTHPRPGATGPEDDVRYEHECRVRDLYAARLEELRPSERLLSTEHTYGDGSIRGDMKTVDAANTIRVWEFEIFCSYTGLGQILTYVAAARRATSFKRRIRGVLAAFEFQREVAEAVDVLNLGVELVHIPPKFRRAGGLLAPSTAVAAPVIPTHAR